ncbi:MAG: ATP-grasp domain-containing protein [Gemmatimonadetes bacterium]|nr:ATP-grasp domain-containing protein [Gemmatimonadota bacterium]MYB62047.1 ATP-grasp domain-containing protein [Gemmatimonadota bacterium]
MPAENPSKRLLLLMPTTTYRADPFLEAARRMNLEVVVGSDFCQVLAKEWDIPLSLRLRYVSQAVKEIVDYDREHPLDAIVPVDDYTTEIAARACKVLGLPHNTPEAAIAARNKYRMREMLSDAGVWCPCFARFDLSLPVEEIALEQRYPCVLKPILLSGSRGVIRADTPDGFIVAFRRIGRILESASDRPPSLDPDARRIMVESYMPGQEVALEGLLNGGRLRVLSLFDKPDPLEGPFFEETIYITPSRLPKETQEAVSDTVQQASTAVGLTEGPVHAELRVHHGEARIIEIAGRSIGGLCSRVLEYGLGVSLEELILRHALGQDVDGVGRKAQGRSGADRGTDGLDRQVDAGNKPGAAGVMMLPVPEGGLFQGYDGVEEAKKTPGVEDVVVTAKEGDMLTPLPEGAGYPGFIFAKGDEPGQVEQVLRKAHGRLQMRVKTVLAT